MVSSCDLAKGVAFLDLVRYDPAGVFGVRSPFTEEGLWIQILGGLVGVEGILVGKEVVGQAAKNVIAKGMRTNMITGGIMLAAQTIPDAVKMCKGKMSAGEFAENTTSNAAGIGAGYAGGTFGAALGTFVCPGVGTVIGGLVGGVAGGLAGSSVVRGVFSLFK